MSETDAKISEQNAELYKLLDDFVGEDESKQIEIEKKFGGYLNEFE